MLACDTNGMHDDSAMCLIHFFVKVLPSAAINVRLCLKPTSSLDTLREKAEKVTTYPELLSYLFQTYATVYAISKTYAA